jgi:hypothetical protein
LRQKLRFCPAFVFFCVAVCAPARAQSPEVPPAPATPRVEVQAASLSTRYRIVENNDDAVTSNHIQYKDLFRARLNLDRDRRFTINIGAGTGSSFTSSWDATGIGSGSPSASAYVKQLYGALVPLEGLEFQIGGLYINHGDNTEVTSYDDDGYIMGERIALRRPSLAYFDEVSVTRAALRSLDMPGVIRRLELLGHQNYWQAQIIKRVSSSISASADFTEVSGAETLRAAVAMRLPKGAPLSAVRFEQYRRVTINPAYGFAVIAERPVTTHARVQAGYATIDPNYGGLNGDRIQRGQRIFGTASIPLTPALNVQIYATQAFGNDFTVTNHTRFDAVVTYDVLAAVRQRHRQ